MEGKRILVVDDEKDLREALYTALTNANLETLVAKDGKEGLQIALEQKPDLILLDIMMPNMNGHEVLRELRQDPWGKDAPVLLLTNQEDPKDIVEGFGFKADEYIMKSNTSLSDIVTRVKQYLGGYHD